MLLIHLYAHKMFLDQEKEMTRGIIAIRVITARFSREFKGRQVRIQKS
jgi:hypothetical protein